MPLFEEDIGVFLGSRSMAIVLGEPTDLRALVLPSLRRGIATVSQYRLTNASFNTPTVDLYFADPGENIEDIFPSVRGLPFALSTGVTPQFAQEFEVYLTVEGEKTVLAGPVSITFETDDVVELVLLDTADPNVAELLVFSNLDPAP